LPTPPGDGILSLVVARKVAKKASAKGTGAPITSTAPPEPEVQSTGATGFPIVGLGASAGGLEAFEQFFRRVPSDSGIAFVLVQHLDPGHASVLTEILQRSTAMPVVEAQIRWLWRPTGFMSFLPIATWPSSAAPRIERPGTAARASHAD
jgi:chemotaxis response regulator CheB